MPRGLSSKTRTTPTDDGDFGVQFGIGSRSGHSCRIINAIRPASCQHRLKHTLENSVITFEPGDPLWIRNTEKRVCSFGRPFSRLAVCLGVVQTHTHVWVV